MNKNSLFTIVDNTFLLNFYDLNANLIPQKNFSKKKRSVSYYAYNKIPLGFTSIEV